jgi:nucleoside-diphosphate-sugar epimerase
VHVDDVVSALERCGNDLRARDQIFNLSNDCALFEIVDAIASEFNVKLITLALPEKLLRLLVQLTSWSKKMPLTQERIYSLMRQTRYSTAKLKELLDFEPKCHIPDVAISIVKVV